MTTVPSNLLYFSGSDLPRWGGEPPVYATNLNKDKTPRPLTRTLRCAMLLNVCLSRNLNRLANDLRPGSDARNGAAPGFSFWRLE